MLVTEEACTTSNPTLAFKPRRRVIQQGPMMSRVRVWDNMRPLAAEARKGDTERDEKWVQLAIGRQDVGVGGDGKERGWMDGWMV